MFDNPFAPGDDIVLSGVVRDLHKATNGEWELQIRTKHDQIWKHNPHVNQRFIYTSGMERIKVEYGQYIRNANNSPMHYMEALNHFVSKSLGVDIPITEFKGDIHLGLEDEKRPNVDGPYWLVVAGGKDDFTCKWWNPKSMQAVIDHYKDRFKFVQVGRRGKDGVTKHYQPRLRDTIDLVNDTSLRELVRLVYHADGVICPTTMLMHMSAAVPMNPAVGLRGCVVVAGGREPAHWEQYPGHRFLDRIGSLDCCATGGCWKRRCQKIGDNKRTPAGVLYDDNLCKYRVEVLEDFYVPRCMQMIQPEHVISAMETYYAGEEVSTKLP